MRRVEVITLLDCRNFLSTLDKDEADKRTASLVGLILVGLLHVYTLIRTRVQVPWLLVIVKPQLSYYKRIASNRQLEHPH